MTMPALILPPLPPPMPAPVASLPALVQRAARTLASASTAAEVLDAKAAANFAYDAAKAAARFAKSKGAYDEVIAAVYRSQADALEIEAMAKRRLADEYDASWRRGDISGPNGGHFARWENGKVVKVSDENPKNSDLGLTKNEVFRANIIRDAELASPGIVRESIDTILAAGLEPSKAALSREINTRLNSFSGDNEWYTPARYIELARQVMGTIDLDPASNSAAQKVIRATTHYTAETDGLGQVWAGKVWMNPPYSNPEIQQFVEKLIGSPNVTEAIVLTNNSADTVWHHQLQAACSLLCLVKGRIRFESPTRTSNSPAMGQSFFYFGPNGAKFNEVFSEIGTIWAKQ